MNEKEIAERLNQDIDHLLDGHSLPGQVETDEYKEILQTARLMARSDMSSQSRVRKSLKQRLLSRLPETHAQEVWSLNHQKGNQTMRPKARFTLFALTALIILIIAAAATPSGQAFAQNLWHKVGPLIIVNQYAPTVAPSSYGATATPLPGAGIGTGELSPEAGATPRPGEGSGQESAPNPNASPTPLPFDSNFEPLTNQLAQEKYGFQVLEPSYLPDDYQLMTEHQVNRFADGKIVSYYVFSTTRTDHDAPYLSIQQSTYQGQAPMEFMVGDAKVSEVTLRGLTATFIEDALLMTVRDEAGQNVTLPVDYLMWEENGNFFIIDATQLSQEEMVQVAESLK